MGASAAQFEFVAEIIMFLAALAGLGLLGLRADLLSVRRPATVALIGGLATLAASAMLHGAFLPAAKAPAAVIGLRVAGGAALLAGSLPVLGWRGDRAAGVLLRLGAVLVVVSAALSPGRSTLGPDAALVLAAVAVGAAVTHASRSAIGARLAATAAGTLLLIVVVLSAALSTVLSTTVRNDALRRLDSRSAGQTTQLADASVADLRDAKLVLASVFGVPGLAEQSANGGQAAVARLGQLVDTLSQQFFTDVHLLWVGPNGRPLAASPDFTSVFGPAAPAAAADSLVVRTSLATQQPGRAVAVTAGRVVALGVYPATVRPAGGGESRVVGAAVAVTPLDGAYLDTQARDDPTLRLAITDGLRVLSAYPSSAYRLPTAVRGLAAQAMAGQPAAASTVGHDFVVVRTIDGPGGQPVVALVAESPTAVFDRTRDSLFRTLFLIALGGSLLAFLLSVVVSDRINRNLKRLTAAAERISAGETLVRAGVVSDDETGVLAEAFDTMAESIEDKTTALRLAAAEESRLRGRLESVVGGMAEALVAVDPDGRVTDFNRAAEELVGQRRSRVLGRPLDKALAVVLADGRRLAEVVGEPAALPVTGEGSVTGADGRAVPVAVSVAALSGPAGEPTGAVALVRDLRPEQELERMKAEFLSRIGHELRTPLTGILGFSELLARRTIPPAQARGWHLEIVAQARRLLRTVEMLEFFASTGGSRLQLDLAPVSARAVAAELASRWQDKVAGSHPVAVRADARAGDVLADRRWLDLALDELVDNAAKFSPEGSRVTIEVEPRPDDGTVAIAVRDSGKGMSDDERAAAFAEFSQGDASDTRRYGGLGLGLALAGRVAEGHGGRVECSSQLGKGTRVAMVLPAVPAPDGRRAGRRRPASTMTETPGGNA